MHEYMANQRAIEKINKVTKALNAMKTKLINYNNNLRKTAAAATLLKMKRGSPRR